MTEFIIKNILSELLFDNRICESVEDQMIVNYFYEELLLERLLYGEPVTVPELRKLLHNKILNFEFIKLDGEVRPAKGTTMMKYIPQSDHPKGIRPSSPKVATFYDLMKKDWRSVSQRSKEIVLKKSEETGKPVVMVKDKPEGAEVAPESDIIPTSTETTNINIGDVFDFTKISKVKYKAGDVKQYRIPTFITITRKDEEGYWGKTAGSEKEILLNPDRMKRLGEAMKVGDEYQFAKLDKNSQKVFTTIKITRKAPEGFWGKTEGSSKEILLTNERLKRLHKYEQPDITLDGGPLTSTQPTQPIITVDDQPIGPESEPEVEIKGVKPIESSETKKMFHFVNPKTGASQHIEMTPKEVVRELKRRGKDWQLSDEKEFKEKEDTLKKQSTEELDLIPPEHKTISKPKDIINKSKDLENIEADEV